MMANINEVNCTNQITSNQNSDKYCIINEAIPDTNSSDYEDIDILSNINNIKHVQAKSEPKKTDIIDNQGIISESEVGNSMEIPVDLQHLAETSYDNNKSHHDVNGDAQKKRKEDSHQNEKSHNKGESDENTDPSDNCLSPSKRKIIKHISTVIFALATTVVIAAAVNFLNKQNKLEPSVDAEEYLTTDVSAYRRNANEACIRSAITISPNLTLLKSCLTEDANVNFFFSIEPYTPLCTAVYWGCSDEIVTFILDQGAEVDTYCGKWAPALIIAINHKKSSLANILLDHGANPNVTNNEGGNALYAACMAIYDEIIPKLLDLNVHVNTNLTDGSSVVTLCSCCYGLKQETIARIKGAAFKEHYYG